MYSVKELFFTIQGEGANTGRPAVFCRFAACNLWSGLEVDRPTAVCRFCDTDFVGVDGEGGGRFPNASALAVHARRHWQGLTQPLIVLTGGEPLLQLDAGLIQALHQAGFEIAVETNGTIEALPGIDWICVSPKARAVLRQRWGHELKLVHPQPGAEPSRFESLPFRHFYLQPMDGPLVALHTAVAVDYCQKQPQWCLSLQTHKVLGIP